MKIEFTFDNSSNGSSTERYTAERSLGGDDSIRQAALSVINEAAQRGVTVYGGGVSDNDGIGIYVKSHKLTNAETGWIQSGFGIKYTLNRDGSLRMLNDLEPLRHDWSVAELEELISNGYIKGDITQLLVTRPIGLGGSPYDVFDWIGFLSDTTGIAITANVVLRAIANFTTNRKVRSTAQLWKRNGIKYPEQLRDFIDTKGDWTLSEVKKRLRLDDEYAIKILTALGLEAKGDSWRLTHSKSSIANRRRWLRNEARYR